MNVVHDTYSQFVYFLTEMNRKRALISDTFSAKKTRTVSSERFGVNNNNGEGTCSCLKAIPHTFCLPVLVYDS